MSERSENYTVVASRVEREWFPGGRRTFYVPQYWSGGCTERPQSIGGCHSGDVDAAATPEYVWPSVWGFDTEAEAWAVCDKHYGRQVAKEMEAYDDYDDGGPGRGDREDFHADG